MSRGATWTLTSLALVLSAASGGVGMVPYSLHVTAHYALAIVAYGGWAVLAISIASFTIARGETPALSMLGFASAALALLFLVLYFLVSGKTLEISGEDALWEWLAFGTLQLWILGHAWSFSPSKGGTPARV